MRIVLNNREEILETAKLTLTITELLALKKYSFKNLVIKINGQLIKRESKETATLRDGDRVEVIHMISGG